MLIFLKVVDSVHFFVRYTDNIDDVISDKVKYDMLALGEAVVTFADLGTLFAKQRAIGKPLEARFDLFEVSVSLSFTPVPFGVTSYIF